LEDERNVRANSKSVSNINQLGKRKKLSAGTKREGPRRRNKQQQKKYFEKAVIDSKDSERCATSSLLFGK
jgi:hypothetical protein